MRLVLPHPVRLAISVAALKKPLMIAAIVTVSSISIAEAGLRDRCAASTGARSGSAFAACVSAGIAAVRAVRMAPVALTSPSATHAITAQAAR